MAKGGLMDGHHAEFPKGLKVGDFIQLTSHFSDIYFEVTGIIAPVDGDEKSFWSVDYITYDKYGSLPRKQWSNSGGSAVRSVIKAEMAIPVMLQKRLRFQCEMGQYDPFYGFAPRGKALRVREAA